MSSATVTSKGQITIPVDVRVELGLRAGTRVDFVVNDRGGYEIQRQTGSVRDLKGVVPKPDRPVTIEEMNEAIADSAVASAP